MGATGGTEADGNVEAEVLGWSIGALGTVTDDGAELMGVAAPGGVPSAVAVFTIEPEVRSVGVTR
jgi:hypothetical protein